MDPLTKVISKSCKRRVWQSMTTIQDAFGLTSRQGPKHLKKRTQGEKVMIFKGTNCTPREHQNFQQSFCILHY